MEKTIPLLLLVVLTIAAEGRWCIVIYEFELEVGAKFYAENAAVFREDTFIYYTKKDGEQGGAAAEQARYPAHRLEILSMMDVLPKHVETVQHDPADAPLFIVYALTHAWVALGCRTVFHMEADLLITEASDFQLGEKVYGSAADYIQGLFEIAGTLPSTTLLLATEVPAAQRDIEPATARARRCTFNSNSLYNFDSRLGGLYLLFLAEVRQSEVFSSRVFAGTPNPPKVFGVDFRFSKFMMAKRARLALDRYCNITHVDAIREIMRTPNPPEGSGVTKTALVHCHHRKLGVHLDSCRSYLI